jgi:dipeptidyl aminopeptidase/acylaminoacyl peptidase
MAAAIVHREKRPKVPTAEEMKHLMHQAILRNKQVIDWVETQKEFDSKRIGVLGTSMGGINGAMLVGVDSRINSAVLALAGCDIPYILAKSKDRGVQRYQKTYMGEHGVSSDEMYEQLKMLLEWDPKNLAPYVDPGRELLILGVCDKVVPFKKGMELRRAMGGPETKLVLSGHYTAVLYIFDIRHSAYQFFKKKFKE